MTATTRSGDMPLRFHKFYWYVWTPLIFLVTIFTAYRTVNNFVINNSPFQTGGFLLFFFFLFIILEALLSAAPLAIFIGLFKWKKYAWYILMLWSLSNIILKPLYMILGYYSPAGAFGALCGCALDAFILYYYWNRRHLFQIRLKKPKLKGTPPVATVVCNNCGQAIPCGSQFCAFCGSAQSHPIAFCRNCGLELTGDSKFCPQCGTPIIKE